MEATEMHAAWGKRIRRLRRERELTATAVASEVGITRQYFHAIERGMYAPSDDVRVKIAKAIGVEPEEIFNYDLSDAS
jgi:DNA-binding XRE family transcriptional regulator